MKSSTKNKPPLWQFFGGEEGTIVEIYRDGELLGNFSSPVKGAARRFAIRVVRTLNSGKVSR